MGNPFQNTYAAIIDTLTGSDDVTAIVDGGNIVRLDTAMLPLIDDRQTGDLPALILWPMPGGERNLHWTSSSSKFELAFELEYRTDQEKLSAAAGLFALDWAVMVAFRRAMPAFAQTPAIIKFELGEWSPLSPFEQSESQETGWNSRLGITVTLDVSHDLM